MRSAGLCLPDMMGTAGQIAALAEWEADWNGFDDDASRRCFLSVMLYRLTWDARWLEPVRLPYRDMYFFTDALAVDRDEVLVDGGAFDGDTVAAFAACTGGTHRHIHAFEADPTNLPRLRECVTALPRVTIYPIGLWSHADTLHFSSGHGPGGRLDDGGDVSVAVQALDDLGLGPVSFIKLDIEGPRCPPCAERNGTDHPAPSAEAGDRGLSRHREYSTAEPASWSSKPWSWARSSSALMLDGPQVRVMAQC